MIIIEKYKMEVLPNRCGQAVLPQRSWSKTTNQVHALGGTATRDLKKLNFNNWNTEPPNQFMHLADIMWLQQL